MKKKIVIEHIDDAPDMTGIICSLDEDVGTKLEWRLQTNNLFEKLLFHGFEFALHDEMNRFHEGHRKTFNVIKEKGTQEQFVMMHEIIKMFIKQTMYNFAKD